MIAGVLSPLPINSQTLLGFAAPYRPGIVLAITFMLAESAAALSIPWLGGKFAADLISEQTQAINGLLLVLLIVFAMQALVGFAARYLSSRVAEHISSDLRVRVYDHLQALPLSFFHERRRGHVLAILINDVS